MRKAVLNRLREPSTWAGLSALAVLFGAPPGTVEAVSQVAGGLAAVAAVVLPEKPKAEPEAR